MTFPLQVLYTPGATVYAVVRGVVAGTRQYWNKTLNAGAGGWEAYNSAHWAQYALPLTEDAGSGYFAANYPANIAGVLTTEAYYFNAVTPTLGDAPIAPLSQSQGANVAAVGADATVAPTLQQALTSEATGVAAGVPTVSVIPTNLANAQANSYAGRSVLFTSGAAAQCAGRIVGYAVVNGVLTLAAPLPVAPAAGDKFVIV